MTNRKIQLKDTIPISTRAIQKDQQKDEKNILLFIATFWGKLKNASKHVYLQGDPYKSITSN